MSSAEEQGIPQTGEEDPLVLVDDPIVGEAVAEMASGQAGRGPAAGESADRRARQGGAESDLGDRQGGFHRRDGRLGLACAGRSTISSIM